MYGCNEAKQLMMDYDDEQCRKLNSSISARKRQLSHVPLPSNGLLVKQSPEGWAAISPTRKRRTVSEQIDLHDRAMQLNTSPILAPAASPVIHRDNWQQRRYNFLSKNSMFAGELKNEVVNEIGTETEQRPIMNASQMKPSSSMESDGSNAKRESVLGMAVSGVRNFLVETDKEEPMNENEISLKNIVLTKPKVDESTKMDEYDTKDKHLCTKYTQTDNDLSSIPKAKFVRPRLLNKIFLRKQPRSKKLVDIQQSYRCHRPYFTYWVTFVQIFVCIVSLIVYGYAPLTSTQSKKTSIFEHQRQDLTMNPWFGPYPADLIRLGAQYTPCMRRHDEVEGRYEKQARLESMSGCCIDSTTGRCMQTISQQCLPRAGLVWHRFATKSKSLRDQHNVIYPAVCGLTPEICTKQSVGNIPREDDRSWASTVVDSKVLKWSSNAAKWPVCLKQDHSRIAGNASLYPHMQCINLARPCCTGVLGSCLLTSKDDCQRRRGIFHPRAHLCSQVDCIQSVCGMLEFFVVRVPDQVYRFWTVIFIHAGLIHLLITIIFQYLIMRPLEKLAGCIRVMIIYVVSGFVGSLASALFLRDSIQVGPGGGQLAILACYLSELFLGWRSLKRPWVPFFKILICSILLLTVGLLPLVDNYSQCFGFLIGFLLNMIVFPDVSFRKNIRRLVVVSTSLALTIALFISLIVLFYTIPFKCSSCKFLSCPSGEICNSEKRDLN
ncbi:unnamed protein product [Adineta ricciae]|uniref:Peptidase S54 rhomboid domain-containing protein n=1 Tax=Adineta ricciae TaxID=249248 RepID=A0A814CPG0_ADIRI|nr:unnamed protein product [Adineta ricciae]CAF0947350.1 unnamed protein product [Adineta ricciae]